MKYFFLISIITYTSLSGWYIENEFPTDYFQYISIVDTSVVWAIGFNGQTNDTQLVASRTLSGWQRRPSIGLPFGFLACVSIAGTDSMNAFVGTRTGKVFRTTNGGANWQLQLDAGGGYINDIQFSRINPAFGYIFCDPPGGPGTTFRIYKTSNYGENWIMYSPSFGTDMVGYDRSISVTDSNHVWFGLYCTASNCVISKIGYTTDGGNNWNTLTVPDPNGYGVTDVEFNNNNTLGLASCYTGGLYSYIFRTTNSGANWTAVYTMPVIDEIHNMVNIGNSTYWYYCITNQIRKSTNDGSAWTLSASLSNTDQFTHMDAIGLNNRIYAWAVLNTGSIMKLVDSVSTIGISTISNEVPENYSLSQNYPNPFNPVTNIKFDLPQSGFVTLKVYNLLGEEVSTLVNQDLAVGTYKVDFDGTNLASGTYLYKLNITNNNSTFSDVKKMILVK